MIFLTLIVGGATRLTESGLSIVEWKPVTGSLPPLTETEWTRAFEAYKTIPQYRQMNAGMSLDQFKNANAPLLRSGAPRPSAAPHP